MTDVANCDRTENDRGTNMTDGRSLGSSEVMDELSGENSSTADPLERGTTNPWAPPTMVPLTPTGLPETGAVPPMHGPIDPAAPDGEPHDGQSGKPRRRWIRRIGIAAAVAVAMVGSGIIGAVVGQRLDDDGVRTPPQRASEAAFEVGATREGDLPPINVGSVAQFVAPSVVTISADLDQPGGEGGSIGTGVIATSDGEIVTNAHVVEGATAIRVRLAGESEPREATLLAADPNNDLALLRIAGDGFEAAVFAEPDSVRIGDEVVAIGFALDLDGAPSVTLGIVSALERTISAGGPFSTA